ncbi:MAG: YiiX/YebB-like N1pC/P60 family cysteine hydrolase [Planctomycetota bacterium]
MNDLFCMKKPVVLLIVVSLSIFGCNRCVFENAQGFVPEEGDLLFQDLDCGPLCDAIEKVTTGFGGADFSHVGIVAKDTDSNFVVIEAVQNGVQATPLQRYLERNLNARGKPKVVAGRLKRPYRHLVAGAIKEAFALEARAYDKAFVISNDTYYCSELIYEIFLRANDNEPVFRLQPMTFKDPDTGAVLAVWQEYFSELGICVPEGKNGINPGGISRSPVLTIVHTYDR